MSSFHLYSEGYDGYARYGDYPFLLKRVTPPWLVFPLGADHLHVQFDGEDHVDLVTLQVPRPAA